MRVCDGVKPIYWLAAVWQAACVESNTHAVARRPLPLAVLLSRLWGGASKAARDERRRTTAKAHERACESGLLGSSSGPSRGRAHAHGATSPCYEGDGYEIY